ncbi:MAG: hypothetical protein HQL93_09715, partial [Magnetococcales bacterium]|nr:hypothetical protein [Magnetococcales bacterium]
RGCVFCGSVNPGGNGYLKDPTGARRFWPVACEQIDLAGLAEARDQLLSEAVVAYLAGEQWYLSKEQEEIAAVEQEYRLERDEWTDLISKYLFEGNYSFVTVSELLGFCFNIEKAKWPQADQNRVAKCLKILKWKKVRKRINGCLTWGYSPEKENCSGCSYSDNSEWEHQQPNLINSLHGGVPSVPSVPSINQNAYRENEVGKNASHTHNAHTHNAHTCRVGKELGTLGTLGTSLNMQEIIDEHTRNRLGTDEIDIEQANVVPIRPTRKL